MKAQISRISHDPARDYAGVLHVQGGLITDADLNEQAGIARDRTDLLGRDAVRGGSPAVGGIADLSVAPLKLRPGAVYAGGLRGMLRAGMALDGADPLDLIRKQADLPGVHDPAAVTAAQVVYADIWHRPVLAAEDPDIAEVALHGAMPSFRDRTVTQLRLAPAAKKAAILAQDADFPAIGTGTLTVTATGNAEAADPCDPCATEVDLGVALRNALFRIEVVDVAGAADAPTSIALAWSMENAAETAAADALPEGFTDGTFAFEHFDAETENHQGVFADPALRRRSAFLADVNAAHARKLVRRWDGHARFSMSADDVTEKLGTAATGNAATVASRVVTIGTALFVAKLDLAGKAALAGDFWLIELRENGVKADGTPDPFRVVSATPIGIRHHTFPLFHIENRAARPLTSAERRALAFPALSDLPASHVSYQNNCARLFGAGPGAQTVQEALDELCKLDATKVPWANSCPDTFGRAGTVAEALDALCGIGKADLGWMRHVFDWGVACGLKVRLRGPQEVEVDPGAWLDWTGTFGESPWQEAHVVPLDRIAVDRDARFGPDGVCFGLEIVRDKEPEFVIGPHETFRLKGDTTFQQRLIDCVAGRDDRRGFFAAALERLSEDDAALLREILALGLSGSWAKETAGLTPEEGRRFARILKVMDEGLEARFGAETARTVRDIVAEIEREDGPRLPAGPGQDALRMRTAARIANVHAAAVAADDLTCACDALFPDCPAEQVPVRLPLARLIFDDSGKSLVRVCMVTCRKQALTPRTLAYYQAEPIHEGIHRRLGNPGGLTPLDTMLGWIAEHCCRDLRETGTTPTKPRPWIVPREKIAGAPRREPRYYEVEGLPRLAAEEMLRGNGLDPVVVADLTDKASLAPLQDLLAEARGGIDAILRGGGLAAPGDQVALLLDGNGVAQGLLVVGEGQGRYPFDPREPRPGVPLTEIEARAKEIEETVSRAGETLGELMRGVERAREQLGAMDAERDRLRAEIRSEMRAEQPVAVLLGREPGKVAGWAALGVATLGELVELSDDRLAQAEEAKLATRDEIDELRAAARRRIGG